MSLRSLDNHRLSGRDDRIAAMQPPEAAHPTSWPALPAPLGWLARIGPLPGRRPDKGWFRPTSWKDLGLASLACAVAVVSTLASLPRTLTAADFAGFWLSLVPLLLLAWRPRLCEWLLAVALACWVAGIAVSGSGGDFAVIVAIYTVGTHRTWRRTAAAILISACVAAATVVERSGFGGWPDALLQVIAVSVGYSIFAAVGLYLGRRRAYVRTLVERTENLEQERELLERERDLMTQRAVAVERARIARELHDVVAHHVSVMVIQAGAAQASMPPGADAAGQAIEAIRETGREAMAEMRRLLGLLRSEEAPEGAAAGGTTVDPTIAATRAPQPGVTDLEALASRTSEAGVEVSLQVIGSPRHIPSGVELSAYRVAQEALTNTLRHAGPGARAVLRLSFEPGALAVEVVDDGHGQPAVEAVERARGGVGHGLVGMRERVALFGGSLETGPVPGGGYRVLARFPLDESSDVGGDMTGVADGLSRTGWGVSR